jgi:uncharacterized protein
MKIEGWASIFGTRDHEGDVVMAGAFKRSLEQRRRVGMLFAHDAMRPCGRWDLLEERTEGLWAEGVVTDDQVAQMIEDGVLFGLSIGYCGMKVRTSEPGFRELEDVELIEVSVTATPMNHDALILR